MALNFPTGPTSGATYTYSGKTWRWNGYAWDIVSPSFVNTLNGATGNLSITGSANQVTVNTSSPQIVIGLPSNLTVGNLTVTGSLLVSGGITTQISEVVLIEDNIVVLNANVTGGSPTENAGIQVSRGASAAVQLLWNETTDKWTFTNDGSQYYDLPVNVVNTVNGATGNIVSIATTGSNVFTGLNTFNAGLTTSHFYVSGGATFSGSTLAFQGTNAKTIQSTQAPLTIKGVTSGAVSIGSYNAVVLGVQDTDPLQLYSTTGLVDINSNVVSFPYSTSIRLNTSGGEFGVSPATVTIQPITYFTADRTINIPDASGTLALTGANTFSGLQIMNAGLTASNLYVTNGATFAARASFNSGLSSANLFVSGGGTFGTSVSISGGTAWHANNDGKNSGLDADLLRGVNGDRYLEEIQSGLLYGGVLSINGTTGFNVSAGAGIVITLNASLTGYPAPTLTTVAWNSFTGQAVTGLTSGDFTFVRIDSSGNLQQSTSDFTQSQYLSSVVLGNLVHPSRSHLDRVHSHPIVAYASSAQYETFIRYFGPLKVSGYAMSGYGTTGQVQVSSGIAFALGANMENDPNNPSVVTDSANTPLSTFYYLYRNADGSYKTDPTTSTVVNFGKYDNGSGTLANVSANRWSIQRVYKIPGTSVVYVYYGRDTYATDTGASVQILSESFDEADITRYNGVFLGWLIVRGAGSNVGNTSDCLIVPGGFFRNTTGGGGAATVANLDDLGDVVITTPSSNQILRYDSTQSLWVNSPVSNVAVTTFNGASGPVSFAVPLASASVTGVASFGNEFTVSAAGAVGLTSNYVKSVNGLTGTVVGIATTGSNVFTGLQTMNAGLTANNLYVSQGATFASPIQGTAASFTGLVSSTIGFSGSAANLVGNASGLTAGTASKVQIAEAASASYYLALASGVGNTGIFVDTTVPRWLYNTSTGALTTTTGSVEAASLIATSTGMFSNTWEGFDGTTPMNIRGPYFDGTFQPIYIGDVNGDANGTLITIDDAANTVQISDNANLLARGATFSGNLEVKQHINMNWSGQGAATQLFTAKNSGGLKISHESGKRITIGSGGVADRETYISVTEDAAGVNNTGKIEFGWTRTDDPEADPVEYVTGYFVFPQSSGVTGNVLRVQSHDGNTSVLEWSAVIGVTGATGATGPVGDYVISFNGLTGAVTGVSRVNGLTGGLTFAAGTGITFTASAGTITLSTTGGGGSKTYAVYTPLDNQPPAANYATIDTRNSIMVLDFDAATDESAVFVGIMPEAASLGSGLKIRINWMATSATSGTCRWGVQIERMNTDEDSDSFDTAATAGSTTNATSGIITTTEITITTIDSVAAGDPFRIKVFRDADGTSGTDDMTGDAELVSVEVRSAA